MGNKKDDAAAIKDKKLATAAAYLRSHTHVNVDLLINFKKIDDAINNSDYSCLDFGYSGLAYQEIKDDIVNQLKKIAIKFYTKAYDHLGELEKMEIEDLIEEGELMGFITYEEIDKILNEASDKIQKHMFLKQKTLQKALLQDGVANVFCGYSNKTVNLLEFDVEDVSQINFLLENHCRTMDLSGYGNQRKCLIDSEKKTKAVDWNKELFSNINLALVSPETQKSDSVLN